MLAGRAPATGDGQGDVKPDGGGEDLRPGAPGWRQAVDDHYASLADALETMDPDTRARFEDDYARATGVLPGAVAKRLRAGLLSADPTEQAAAATRLTRLKEADPALVSAIPANDRRRAQAIAEFVDLGLPPARAVELAEEKLADAGEDDQPAGEDDELAMGAAREAAKAAAAAALREASKALREASKIGRMILDRLKGLRPKKGEGQPPGPGVIAVETVANVVRAKLEERAQARAKAGKEPTIRKLPLVLEDFGPDADATEVIRAMAEARLVQAIRSNEPAVQLNLEPVEDGWAARVKKDTTRLGKAVDVAGLRHAIDTVQIAHAFNDHAPGNESDPDNEPISPEAIAAYLEVVKNYDRIRTVRAKGGVARIAFEKRVDGLQSSLRRRERRKKRSRSSPCGSRKREAPGTLMTPLRISPSRRPKQTGQDKI